MPVNKVQLSPSRGVAFSFDVSPESNRHFYRSPLLRMDFPVYLPTGARLLFRPDTLSLNTSGLEVSDLLAHHVDPVAFNLTPKTFWRTLILANPEDVASTAYCLIVKTARRVAAYCTFGTILVETFFLSQDQDKNAALLLSDINEAAQQLFGLADLTPNEESIYKRDWRFLRVPASLEPNSVTIIGSFTPAI